MVQGLGESSEGYLELRRGCFWVGEGKIEEDQSWEGVVPMVEGHATSKPHS